MSDEDTTLSNDSTREKLSTQLERADALLKLVEEGLQNPLANANRRIEAGQAVETDKVLATAEKKIVEIERQVRAFSLSDQQQAPGEAIQSGLIDYWSHVGQFREGTPTGLGKLNSMLGGGLHSKRLLILLGAPGGGKTTLANQIAEHVAGGKNPVLYVTSEDIPFNLLAKTLARKGQLNYSDVLRGRAAEPDNQPDISSRIEAALTAYRESQAAQYLHYYDATMGSDLDAIRKHAESLFSQHRDNGPGLLVIDYLQRIARAHPSFRTGNFDLRKAVTILTEDLRGLAVELDCCVLALASQHRASGYGAGANSLASAKESGDIEYTADVMMALGEDDRAPTMSTLEPRVLRLDKNRLGPTGAIALDWYGERQQFTCANVEPGAGVSENGRGKRGR